MSVGKNAQDLKEEEVGKIAKVAYDDNGQTFDIIYPNAEKFPDMNGNSRKLKFNFKKSDKDDKKHKKCKIGSG